MTCIWHLLKPPAQTVLVPNKNPAVLILANKLRKKQTKKTREKLRGTKQLEQMMMSKPFTTNRIIIRIFCAVLEMICFLKAEQVEVSTWANELIKGKIGQVAFSSPGKCYFFTSQVEELNISKKVNSAKRGWCVFSPLPLSELRVHATAAWANVHKRIQPPEFGLALHWRTTSTLAHESRTHSHAHTAAAAHLSHLPSQCSPVILPNPSR